MGKTGLQGRHQTPKSSPLVWPGAGADDPRGVNIIASEKNSHPAPLEIRGILRGEWNQV
jgi:hypothetical protein